MKKEIFAALLLLVLLALSYANIFVISTLCEDVSALVESAGDAAKAGDFEAAEASARRALELFERYAPYTHIVLRHMDIETLTHGFYELLGGIYLRSPGDALASAQLIVSELEDIREMESISWGSVF